MSPLYPLPGAVLAGRYLVGSVIGRGGMGVVLEARNTVTQRRVAIKWILGDASDGHEAAERLTREASAASAIRHPNVVDVYDVLRDQGAIFLVMELLEGEPLAALLRRGGTPLPQLITLLIEAMHGVAAAHRLDIVHRDIHPGNIFLAEQGHDRRLVPKVLDFGISKLGAARVSQPLTRSNICMGTPLYMSYEQLCSARDVDRRTDIYSFGVILYEAITGLHPHDGDSLFEVAGKVAGGKLVHPKVLRPDIPSALAALVLWAMANDKDARLSSMESFIAELEPFASTRAFRAQMTQPDLPLPSVLSRRTATVAAGPALTPQPPVRSANAATTTGAAARASGAAKREHDTLGRLHAPLARRVTLGRATVRRSLRVALALALGGVTFAGGVWYASLRAAPDLAARDAEARATEGKSPAASARTVDASDPRFGADASKPVVVQPAASSTGPAISAPDAGLVTRPAPPAVPIWRQRVMRQRALQRTKALSSSVDAGQDAEPVGGSRAGPIREEDMLPSSQ